jgi:hypothetical protein
MTRRKEGSHRRLDFFFVLLSHSALNLVLPDSNKNLVVSQDGCFIPRQTGRLTVGRNMTQTHCSGPSCVEAGSNTSTIALRVIGGEEKGIQCVGV